MTRSLVLGLLALASLTPSYAHASTYNVTFCTKYGVNFGDASSSTGDDYLVSNTAVSARGARVRVKDNDSGSDVFFDYTDDSGADVGCTPSLALDSTKTYWVSVQSRAYINGNYVTVLNDPTSGQVYSYVAYAGYIPASSTTVTFTTSLADQWNIMAAGGWAMYRRNVGLASENLIFYTQACPGTGAGSCESDEKLYIELSSVTSQPNASRKYVIVHEMGHAMAEKANGGGDTAADYTADPANCYSGSSAHQMNSKEFQSAAANEGIAHYYAAIAFNDSSEDDCAFYYYKSIDWDLDGSGDAVQYHSCEVGPATGIDEYDYHGDMCTGAVMNRATEYDWLRFWWDLNTDEGVSTNSIFNIWDAANPDSWQTNGTGAGYVCGSTDWPAGRLRCAAQTRGYLTEWDAQDNDNGVHR